MKVLLAHPSSELYGSDRQLAQSVTGFQDAGWDVTVVLPARGALGAQLDGVDVETATFPVLRKAQLRPAGLLRLLLTTPAAVLRLARLVRAVAPDLVYVNTVTLPHWVLAARLARRPVLVHVHEAEELSSTAVRRLLYAPLRVSRAVIVNSATTARVVGAACPSVRTRLTTILNGVPDAGARPDTEVITGRLTLVTRLSPRKGVDIALEAVALLRAAGRDVTLTVCGSAFDGYEWFRDELLERAGRADLAGHVTFTGFTESVQAELGRAQVVLAPSFGESFGNAAVEGLLARRPVVASDVQGLAEIVQDDVTGLLVPVGDAAALAAAVGRVLDDPEFSAVLADRGRADAVSRFSTARYRREVVDVAARSLAGAGRTASTTGAARAALLTTLALLAVLVAGCSGSGSGGSASATGDTTPTANNVISGSAGPVGASGAAPTATRSRLTSTLPAPGSGNIHQTVSAQPVLTRPAVKLSETAAFGNGLTVRVTGHAVIAGKATRPGEVSGRATELGLRITNGTGGPVSLDDVVVTDTDARGNPLVALAGSPSAPFHGQLPRGGSARATYVFVLAQGRHNPYTIRVSSPVGEAVVQFVGDTA